MSNNYYSSRTDGNASGVTGCNNCGLQEVNSASSLNSRSTAYNPLSGIQHTSHLIGQISNLYLNEDCSDLTLIVEEQRFPVHRVILGTRSSYFHAMLYGGLRESNETEVTLIDTHAEAFKVLLKYIYTGKLQLKTLSTNLVLYILGLVHKYGFTELESAIPEYLKTTLEYNNVCTIFTFSHHYSIECLMTACLDFIDNCASEILGSQTFIELPAQALIKILGRNSFYASELEIFEAVRQWIQAHPDETDSFHIILAQIRLSLIKMDDLFGPIRDSGLISADQILDAIKDQNLLKSSQLKNRGFLIPGINIATQIFGATVTTGEYRTALLDNQNTEEEAIPTDRTYARHLINPRDSTGLGITIELGRPFILNNIRLHLMDRDQRAYSYYIEISIDRHDWVKVIDHTHYLCRSKQNLLFEQRVMKYIRIVGTHSTVNNYFQLGNFEALYTNEDFEIDSQTTLQIPKTNIATISNNAIVIEGVSRSRNALLNGETSNYDWDNGYTCHQLGSGALVVQLPQPYMIGTMRALLWDCDDRCYSFYIEVSTDQIKWTKIAEFSECRSWQTTVFDLLPVIFVRIVGTYNSANEVFHLVHFECPAMKINAAIEQERLKRIQCTTENNLHQPSSSSSEIINVQMNESKTMIEVVSKDEEDIFTDDEISIDFPINLMECGQQGETTTSAVELPSQNGIDVERSESEPAQSLKFAQTNRSGSLP